MREILLTNGGVALIDDRDAERVLRLRWYKVKSRDGHTFYARSTVAKIKLHAFILNTNRMIDHANRDGLDNRRVNLRLCTGTQNQANRKPTASRVYKGTTKTRNGRWIAMITCNKQSYYIGTFNTEQEAARAYDVKANEMFGEFARLNFPGEPKIDIEKHRTRKTRRSKYKGVDLTKDGKWRARVSISGERISVGRFDNQTDAWRAICEKVGN